MSAELYCVYIIVVYMLVIKFGPHFKIAPTAFTDINAFSNW